MAVNGGGTLPAQEGKASTSIYNTDWSQSESASDSQSKPDLNGEPKITTSAYTRNDVNAGLDPEKFYYEFVGECYVHGMTGGDTITPQNDEGIKIKVFEMS